jgi:hypothetical protein
VGYRLEHEIDWRVGIIRRLGRSHGKPNAGLTVFLGIPASATPAFKAIVIIVLYVAQSARFRSWITRARRPHRPAHPEVVPS